MKYEIKTFTFDALDLPEFKEVRGKDWVSFGADNKYPDQLIELLETSAIHNTAVQSKTDAVIGEGVQDVGESVINANGETLNELYEKIAYDKVTFNGYCLNVIWNRAGDKVVEIYHLPFSKVRSGKLNEEDKVTEYFYSSNWANTRKYIPVRYAAYSQTDNKGENASQIFYQYDYSPAADVYPLPDYIGAINDIELDARISRFHNANISNGLTPSLLINMPNGEPEDDDKRRLYNDLNASFGGEENAGRLMLTFSEGPELAPQIQTIDAANDDYYIILEERITSRILTAHRITSPLLVGIRTTGAGLGSNSEEIEVAYTHFLSTVIQPIQKSINRSLSRVLNAMAPSEDNVMIQVIPSKMDFNTTTTEQPVE
jgi:hypothetical protein